jgi:hypothetical protein
MNRVAAAAWSAAAFLFAYISLVVAGGPKADISGWALALCGAGSVWVWLESLRLRSNGSY